MFSGFMSFELPRANKSLRFTGEVKAAPLGKPRSKPDVYQQETAPTPFIAARPSVRAELAARPIRSPFDSLDENAVTRAMPRDEFEIQKAPKPPKNPQLGVPNFRRQASPPEPAIVHVPRLEPKKKSSAGLAILVWAFVAIIGGAASYRFAPEILENVKTAAKAFD
jgi:hypothetical protein